MIKVFKYFTKVEWSMALITLLFIVLQVWMELSIPRFMAEITTLVQTPGNNLNAILMSGGGMMLATLGSLVAAVVTGYFVAMIGARFSRRLRSLMFNKVESFSMAEINTFSTDSLITRSTNDITQVQTLITMGLTILIRGPIMAIWATTRIIGKGLEWTLATGVTLLILISMISFLMIFVVPKFRKMQGLIDNMNRVTRENLTGVRVVRAYNAHTYQEDKFKVANDELTNTHLFTGRAMSILWPMLMMMMSGLTLAIYWIGAYLVDGADIAYRLPIFANMVVFSNYAVQVINAFVMMVMIFIMLPRASVSAKRINEVLNKESSIKQGTITQGNPSKLGEIEFKNVSFKYPDSSDFVLKNLNFVVNKGQTMAFIGSTGSGKTSLINLIPRFYDASIGDVLIDGVNVRDYELESLHNKIGYVAQKAILFKGSIQSNVALGQNGRNSYSEEDIKNAVRIAQGQDFVEKKEDGYGSEVSQGGTNLSGGQKQRIAIARAICRKPEIYIFDDSFSALDYKTDRLLQNALSVEVSGATKLIVGQRIGTIMHADQIAVLENGEIVGIGTHLELLDNCEVYQEIAASQLSEEELRR